MSSNNGGTKFTVKEEEKATIIALAQ